MNKLILWQTALWEQIKGEELEGLELFKAKNYFRAVSECLLILNNL